MTSKVNRTLKQVLNLFCMTSTNREVCPVLVQSQAFLFFSIPLGYRPLKQLNVLPLFSYLGSTKGFMRAKRESRIDVLARFDSMLIVYFSPLTHYSPSGGTRTLDLWMMRLPPLTKVAILNALHKTSKGSTSHLPAKIYI